MPTKVDKKEIEAVWRDHCRKAVRSFVMNAVVVDNEPSLSGNQFLSKGASSAQTFDDGMGGGEADEEQNAPSAEGAPDEIERNIHSLDVQAISDAFSDQEIACAFVLPKETDSDEVVVKRVLAAAFPADIIVIDWKLRDGSHQLTKDILKKIAEKDVAENGRLRLICVYTGEPLIDQITLDAVAALREGGLIFDDVKKDSGYARGKYHCLQVLNKHDEGVSVAQLPTRLLDSMTNLADGLLPSFSIAAVAAVRRNMHHIIARFPSELDEAFVANLLITDPQEDVTELIRELFVSECDTALGLERVADTYLSKSKIEDWLSAKKKPTAKIEYEKDDNSGDKIEISKSFLLALLKKGLDGDKVVVDKENIHVFIDKRRSKVSQSLHGSKAKAKVGEGLLARFVALKREFFGNTKISSEWKPSLTLGSILKNKTTKKFYYCITPSCDTIRLSGKRRSFVMLELEQPQGQPGLLIMGHDNKVERFKVNTRPHCVRTFEFQGDDINGRIMAKTMNDEPEKKGFYFETIPEEGKPPVRLEWFGEVRRNRANRDMAELNREWLRLGIKDSEYLRLASKGYAEL
ncbi:hypothetical protein DBW_1161 [Desulfuromonas sp. DDH964]|uniref:response regulator receiver domain n=1 Tax=Desulfuromonas sp. DDH964 TaxID=1823759 RepID=UPI00078B8221|nr:response regulator receiver domain [Desulfuromonas sp. DDH964]AMV71535.1 hypothetical protein DBW_1161 [Desulfuromonas sp. DDH964]